MTTVRALREAVNERRVGVPFDITVTVTQPCRFKTISNITCVEDETDCIGVKDMVSLAGHDPAAGTIVRYRGTTELIAGVSVFPMATEMTVLGKGSPPVASPVSAAEFHSGKFDQRLVEVEGCISEVIRDEIDRKWCFACIRCPSGIIHVAWPLPMMSEVDAMKLIDAHVRIRGICSNNTRQSTRRYLDHLLSVNTLDNLTVVDLPPGNPFDAPAAADSRMASDLTRTGGTGRRCVTGGVLALWRGNRMLVRTAEGETVQVLLSGETRPSIGETVDVVGFPETDFYRLTLVRALWRPSRARIDTRTPATDVASVDNIFNSKPRTNEVNVSMQGRPIRLTGKVRTAPTPDQGGWQIHIQNGETLIPIYGRRADFFDRAPVDGLCEMTGICLLETESWRQQMPFPRVTGMALVLRSPDDVRLVAKPPFWTPRRLLVVIASLLAGLAAILVWNGVLRVLVERRGRELFRQQIDSATARLRVVERTQLAVELHDSLSQNLAGVALELEAARQFRSGAAGTLLDHLERAWNTLRSCRAELRNCLWDLRNEALEARNLEDAVRTALQPYVGGLRLVLRFVIPRSHLTDRTTHDILRIIRELALNAIRHGRARSLRIAGTLENDELRFSVTDDGCGFDPASVPGVRDGHFGLAGIRERIRPLRGTMTIRSVPGHGSKVTIVLKLPQEVGKDV